MGGVLSSCRLSHEGGLTAIPAGGEFGGESVRLWCTELFACRFVVCAASVMCVCVCVCLCVCACACYTSATEASLPLQPMDTEDVSQLRPKSSRAPPLSPESECFVHLLVLLFLIDGGEMEQVRLAQKRNRRGRGREGGC